MRAWQGTLLLGLAIVLWGTAFRAHAVGAEHAPPLAFAAIRALPAALVLAVLAVALGRRLTWRQSGWAALTGVLMVAVMLGGVCEAIPRAGASYTAVIFNSYPFFVVAVGAWALRERLSPVSLAGLCLGFAGIVVLILAQGGATGAEVLAGTAIAAAAAIAWGTGTIIVARLLRAGSGPDLLAFTAVQYLVGGVVLTAFALPAFAAVDWGSGDLWLAGAWASIGSSAIATVAFFAALRRMPAARASTWQFLVPTVAVAVEAVAGTLPGAVALVGMAISIAGVSIVFLGGPARTTAGAARTPRPQLRTP